MVRLLLLIEVGKGKLVKLLLALHRLKDDGDRLHKTAYRNEDRV